MTPNIFAYLAYTFCCCNLKFMQHTLNRFYSRFLEVLFHLAKFCFKDDRNPVTLQDNKNINYLLTRDLRLLCNSGSFNLEDEIKATIK